MADNDGDIDIQDQEEDLGADDAQGYKIGEIVFSEYPDDYAADDYEELEEDEAVEKEGDTEEMVSGSDALAASGAEKDDFLEDAINYDPDDPEQYWNS